MKRRVAILISGRGSNMSSLIAAAEAPDYPAEIAVVISNVPDAAGLATARAKGVKTIAVDHKSHLSREEFERALQEEIGRAHV